MTSETFSHALPPGTRIPPLTLDRVIGQGAWGIVYDAHHDVWGRVAVKEFFPGSYTARSASGGVGSSAPQWQDAVRKGRERFAAEARALRAIQHPNVVRVYDFVESEGSAFLVMEYVEGETLAALLDAGRFTEPAEIIAFGKTLVATLQALHESNVLHRDIAPDNIMIRPGGSPVLIDFGGAAAAVANATHSTQNIVKDGYSPPEQYDASANPAFPIGPWSDIYACAAVLYRLASKREPPVSHTRLLANGIRGGTDPMRPLLEIAPDGYSKRWLQAVDAGLALVPADRPQSASDWRARFEEPPLRARQPKAGRAPVVAAAASLAACAVIAALAFGMRIVQFGSPVAGTAPAIVAVDGEPVSRSLFDRKLESSPTAKQVLTQLVQQALIDRYAADRHIDISPAAVNAKEAAVKSKYPPGQFDGILKQQNLTEADVQNILRQQLIIEQAVRPMVHISNSDIQAYFNKNHATLDKPGQVRARHILVADEKTAEMIEGKLKAGGNFADLAKQYSIDPSTKDKGGELGFFGKGQMVPAFQNAAFSLPVGAISRPVRSPFGWHIIQVEERTPPIKATLASSRAQITDVLTEQQQQKQIPVFLQGLRAKANIQVYDDRFKDAFPPAKS